MWPLLLALLACRGPTETDTDPSTVGWTDALPSTSTMDLVRGHRPMRTIVHLHSPWSHDACDGQPLPDGAPDESCLADLRAGLCATATDAAFLTDHPAHAAEQDYEDLLLARDGDEPVEVDGVVVGNRIHCDDGHEILWMPGIEDELMPVGLDRHVGADAAANDDLYNRADAESLSAERDAGAVVLMAHTEGRDPDHLATLQDAGLQGVEIFNLHAMFAPDIREDALGLDGLGWVHDIASFTSPDGTGEPDLLFLGVLADQAPSLERFDALLARGPMTGVGGTDAHQNVMNLALRDGERLDSYRRMLRWFSNHVLVDGEGPAALEEALAAGRSYVAFEVLGTPVGFDLYLEDEGGSAWEMGSSPPAGTLHVSCPTLHPASPQGEEAPEVEVVVLRDGEPWQEGCGSFAADGPAVYRVQVDIVPHHLRPFLGDDPDPWLRAFPWIRSNAVRVGL